MKKEKAILPDILKQLQLEELEPRLELEIFIDLLSVLAAACNNNNNGFEDDCNNNNNNNPLV